MPQLGQYPMNGRVLAPTDTMTGVVTGAVADVPLATLAQFILGAGGSAGPTRPSPQYQGQPFYDTTLGQPIWCQQISPPIWHNAAGVAV